MNIFEKRLNILPYEYPNLNAFKDAIRHSYWIHSEFNYTSDINDYKSNVNEIERDVIKKCMLAISQIEVNVKTFWGDLYKRMPKPEIGFIGATMNESEARHADSYQNLLYILGLEKEFETLLEVPCIINRINYLNKYLDGTRSKDNKMFTKSLLLFTLLVENVSLFSQFYLLMSFNKEKNLFKGMSNVVEGSSKDEELHAELGIELINIIKNENPEWFDDEFKELIYSACKKAYLAECGILDWVFEKGELDFISKENIKEFIKDRINKSLIKINFDKIFEINSELLKPTLWFEIELKSTKEGDFFNKRQIDYSKKTKSITEDDLF